MLQKEQIKIDNQVLNDVVRDLLSIPRILKAGTHKNRLPAPVNELHGNFSMIHFEIMHLLMNSGTLRMSEIADELHVPKPQATYLVDRLVNMELAERNADPSDRRTVLISLSDKGTQIFKKHREHLWDSFKEMISGLSGEEIHELSVSLRTLIRILSRLEQR